MGCRRPNHSAPRHSGGVSHVQWYDAVVGYTKALLIVFLLLESGFCLVEIDFLADMGYDEPNSPLVGLALVAASIAFFAAAIWLVGRFFSLPENNSNEDTAFDLAESRGASIRRRTDYTSGSPRRGLLLRAQPTQFLGRRIVYGQRRGH